jgi:hypothetical protein
MDKLTSKNNLFENLSSALGADSDPALTEEEKDIHNLREGRARGMSAVDEGNIMQLKNNTVNMIENHLSKSRASQARGTLVTDSDNSPTRGYESAKDEDELDVSRKQ